MTLEIQDILQQLTDGEEKTLLTAVEKAQRALMESPTEQNSRALRSIKKDLQDYLARENGAKEPELSFKTRLEALAWLQRQGYKIKKSKLYKDAQDGLLKLQADGSVLESDLKRYIRRVNLAQPAETPESDSASTLLERAKQEVIKYKHQNRLLELQLAEKQRKVVSREDFELEFAAKVSVLISGLRNMIFSMAGDWAETVLNHPGGPSQPLAERINKDLDTLFNDLANIKKFRVVFYEESEEDSTAEDTENK
jgi:hypothetical protein